MTRPSLTPDCTKCAALCCIALPFDKSEMFAFDKKGGEACRHLAVGHSCNIHGQLGDRGFRGCIQFDCQGAGQHVVQGVFNGASWQDDASLLPAMTEAFRAMRRVHELLVLLQAARGLPLGAVQASRLNALEQALSPSDGWSEQSLADFVSGALPDEVADFLTSLRDIAAKENPGARARAFID